MGTTNRDMANLYINKLVVSYWNSWNSAKAVMGLAGFFCDPLLTLARTSSGASRLTKGFFSGALIFHTTMGLAFNPEAAACLGYFVLAT